MDSLITCSHLTMCYEKQPVLEDVSFSVHPGEYLCIVGENGSGKSTLVKGLLGLMPAQTGKISHQGVTRAQIGYLPQQTPVQRDFPASVFEVALSGCLARKGLRPYYNRAEKQLAADKLEQLGVLSQRSKSYRALSGGQQQRVLLARALCAADKLLLLDEPAAGLDPLVTSELYELVRNLNKQQGMAVIMVSHDLPEALRSADTILHLHTDTQFYGSVADYRQSDICRRLTGGALDD